MPTSDIRIQLSLKDHRKLKRLIRTIGIGAMHHLVMLWLTTAEQCPSGHLKGWDEQDIADAAQWSGDPQKLIDALCCPDCLWLDKNGDGYHIHDWGKHQSWTLHADERSALARHAVQTRWDKVKQSLGMPPVSPPHTGGTTDSIRSVFPAHTDSNSPSPYPIPNPYPSPNPSPNPSPHLGTDEQQQTWEQQFSQEFAGIVEVFPKHTNIHTNGAKLFYFLRGTGVITKQDVYNRLIPAINQRKAEPNWQKNNGQFVPQLDAFLEDNTWRTMPIDMRYLPPEERKRQRKNWNARAIPE